MGACSSISSSSSTTRLMALLLLFVFSSSWGLSQSTAVEGVAPALLSLPLLLLLLLPLWPSLLQDESITAAECIWLRFLPAAPTQSSAESSPSSPSSWL